MVKIFNKICFHLKNIILPITIVVTVYIVMYMFQRLGKEIFGDSLMEFIKIILPFVLLIILWLVNLFFKQNEVKNNTLYNVTSLLVVVTISIFCYRAMMDENMIFWHQSGYKINFNYFSDQLAAVKVMLYGLFVADVLLMVAGAIKSENSDFEQLPLKMNKKIEKKS